MESPKGGLDVWNFTEKQNSMLHSPITAQAQIGHNGRMYHDRKKSLTKQLSNTQMLENIQILVTEFEIFFLSKYPILLVMSMHLLI